jgi:hypothetical protein
MLQRPLSHSPVACHAVPFAVRSTAGARHEAARNGSDQSLAIRWLWEQGMGWLGTLRPLPAPVTGLADCGTISRNRLVNAAAPNLGSQPRRTYDGIAGLYLDSSARTSCCCSLRVCQHRTTFFSAFLHPQRFRGFCTPTNQYMQVITQALPMPNSYTSIVLGPSSASPDRE